MAMFTTMIYMSPGDEDKVYSNRIVPLGSKGVMFDGREYRFGRSNASTALVRGSLYQGTAPVANHVGVSVQAAKAAGSAEIPLTLGATAATADQYAGGFVAVEDTMAAGGAVIYSIAKTHKAVASAGVFTVPLNGTTKVALTTSAVASLFYNPYDLAIIHPSPPTMPVAGVAMTDRAVSTYGWVQTRGPASVLTDGTVIVGKSVMPSDTVDGAVENYIWTEAAPPTEITEPVGRVMRVVATAKWSAIKLEIV